MDGLIRNSFIKVLNLKRNNIGDRGAIDLAYTLERGTTLEELDLSDNSKIGDAGALAFMRSNRTTNIFFRSLTFF